MISNKDNNKNPTLETGQIITLAGHSGGGLRNYLALLNSNPNQYLNSSGESVLQIQFSGTPVNAFDIYQAGKNSGASIYVNNKTGDAVGNVLGANGDVVDAIFSSYNTWKLFGKNSPHSNYECILSNCNSGQRFSKPITKANQQ